METQIATLIVFAVGRPILFGTFFSFLLRRFGVKYVGRLAGVGNFVIGSFGLLQFGIVAITVESFGGAVLFPMMLLLGVSSILIVGMVWLFRRRSHTTPQYWCCCRHLESTEAPGHIAAAPPIATLVPEPEPEFEQQRVSLTNSGREDELEGAKRDSRDETDD